MGFLFFCYLFKNSKDPDPDPQLDPDCSLADPHHIDADPDPAFHFDADPDPTFQ
jgi:hypothetical protein